VLFEPRTKGELVAAVASQAGKSRSLRALGTNWALSEAGVADDVVCTDSLNLHVSWPYSRGASQLDSQRLRNGGSDFLLRVCASDRRAAGLHFVHVEAGIKIHKLLEDLGKCDLALPTMGTSAGQSLAGALSTGTHGGEFEVPPVVEWIRAIHLVGTGGQEWWITPESSMFADERLLKIQGWCDDARIVANDQAFNAVRIAVGRMGVIYSMILEVQQSYSLVEVNLEDEWNEHPVRGVRGVRKQLEHGAEALKAGLNDGIFDAPLSKGLESEWFRSELLSRTKDTFPHHNFKYEPGRKQRVPPPPSPSTDKRYRELLKELKLSDLADDLRRKPARLHYVNMGVSLLNPEQCWVKRRWRFSGLVREVKPEPEELENIVKALANKDTKLNPVRMIKPLQDLVRRLQVLLSLPWKHGLARLNQFIAQDIPRIAQLRRKLGDRTIQIMSGEALVLTLYELSRNEIFGPDVKPQIIEAISPTIGQQFGAGNLVRAGRAGDIFSPPEPDPPKTPDPVCTPNTYRLDGALSIDSTEFFFDASSSAYIDFIDRVRALALEEAHSPVFGAVGIRFTPRATALLAMQRFPRTVSVEVGTGRAFKPIYEKFWVEVHNAANEYRAIQHWRQKLQQSKPEIEAHFGNDLLTWRRMLAELSIDAPDTFSTKFSQDLGLEPKPGEATGIFDSESVEQFLAGFEATAD
jgi:hypothetical protein